MAAEFCLHCGARLQTQLIAGRERQTCSQCGFILYRNPVPVVGVLVTHNGKILLLKRHEEPLRGFWAPPTGYVEWDESAEQAAVRETFEETGFEIELDGLLGVYSHANTGILFLVYRGRICGGQMQASEESEAIGFFAPDQLPAQPAKHSGTLLDEFFLDVIGKVITNKLVTTLD
ncbi:MAG: NUDIX hydrolase [Chloroflexi bacterium]|nr:NUDIX hydrolase [Chloroflexota bacterium]